MLGLKAYATTTWLFKKKKILHPQIDMFLTSHQKCFFLQQIDFYRVKIQKIIDSEMSNPPSIPETQGKWKKGGKERV